MMRGEERRGRKGRARDEERGEEVERRRRYE